MKIAVLSGKGGTGKTTLSTNLFHYIDDATLVDTDTEEPNSHIFIKPKEMTSNVVTKNIPVVNNELCTHCKKCGSHCNFNAIIPTNKKVLVFEDLCHDCGFCELVCESGAITYEPKEIGVIYSSSPDQKSFHYGKLHVGEVSGVRLIEQLNKNTLDNDIVITDCPPGVSCSTVAALDNSDYAIICAEPTPFGVSDMKMVVELLRDLHIPFGVVVNKSGIGNNEIYDYLHSEKIVHLEDIPFTKERAILYSNGELIIKKDDIFKTKIRNITSQITGKTYD